MKQFLSATEILSLNLPGLPKSRAKLLSDAKKDGWSSKARSGHGGGLEYAVSSLPKAAQKALVAHSIKTGSIEPVTVEAPAAKDLKSWQRESMIAKLSILAEIDRQVLNGLSTGSAIDNFVELAKTDQLPSTLKNLLVQANDRPNQDRTISRTTLYRWKRQIAKADGNVVAVAPKAPKESEIPVWAETFMGLWARPQKPFLTEALDKWPEGEPRPSYDQARALLKRLGTITANKGRMGPRALKALMAYKSRDTETLSPATIYIGDGHTFKAFVAHPVSGRPFRPEITSILDVKTRRWVGFSTALSENTQSVADALRHAVSTVSINAGFYYDNGGGANNDNWDDATTGLCARLYITKMNSEAWGSQSRGVIEKFHSTVLHPLAREFPSYCGERMDDEALRAISKRIGQDLKKTGQSRLLPAWSDLVAKLQSTQDAYNARPHSTLPKIIDEQTGRRRHMSPQEMWDKCCADGWVPDLLSADEAVDLFRPEVERTVRRCLIEWLGNKYYAQTLAEFHGEKVIVGYDIHDATRVWVRHQDGRFICEATFDGNKSGYIEQTYQQKIDARRLEGQLHRTEVRRQKILENSRPTLIEHQPTMPFGLSADDEQRADAMLASFEPQNIVTLAPASRGDGRPVFADLDHRMSWMAEHASHLTDEDYRFIAMRRAANSTFEDLYDRELARIFGAEKTSAA